MKNFNASELFDFSMKGVFPLDLDFILKNQFKENELLQSKGVYAMVFKDELLYIGSYSGDGNVAEVRWQNELQTHSLRGCRVGFTPAAWNRLQGTQMLRLSNFPHVVKDTGYLTSAKRVLFADEYWHLLAQNAENWLSHFSFCWLPLPKDTPKSKQEIEDLTKQLLKFYNPRCNG
jgi:hypothetical protein